MPKHLTVDDSDDFVASDQVGAANGVAALDGTGKVPSAQLPTAISNPVLIVNGHEGPEVTLTSSDVGALAPATADGRYILQTSRAAANGVPSLDSGGHIPAAQVPDLSTSYVAASRIGANNGVAGLDGSGKLAATAQVYGASTAAVASAGAAGVANTAARGDHVHQGVLSVNTFQGAVTLAASDVGAVATTQNVDNTFAPGDQGMIAWSGDPQAASVTIVPTSGQVRLTKIVLRRAATLSTVWMVVGTAGSTLTSGQNFLGLYTAAGFRVALTADQTTAWGTSGIKSAAFTGSYAAAAGSYYIAVLAVGTTPPAFGGTAILSGGMAANANLTVSTGRVLVGPSAQTSLPPSLTMASNTLGTSMFWVGVS